MLTAKYIQQPAGKRFPKYQLHLTETDLQQLLAGDWLIDKHINTINELLHNQFPLLNDFQDPLTLVNSVYPYKSLSKNFIQIINISNQHRMCASNMLCTPGQSKSMTASLQLDHSLFTSSKNTQDKWRIFWDKK